MTAADIHAFARIGNVDAIQRAVEAGINVNTKNAFGSTPLQSAIAEKQVPAVERLLELGADVAIQDADGRTALHYAIEHKLPAVLELLLKRCPEAVSVSDRHGNQPLWTAAFNARGNYEMVSMLLQCGADPNHLNNSKLSPIDIATRKTEPELLKLLDARP